MFYLILLEFIEFHYFGRHNFNDVWTSDDTGVNIVFALTVSLHAINEKFDNLACVTNFESFVENSKNICYWRICCYR